jgi:hypothetical protein
MSFTVLITGKYHLVFVYLTYKKTNYYICLYRYHLGQHRAYPGKCTNMEEDIK